MRIKLYIRRGVEIVFLWLKTIKNRDIQLTERIRKYNISLDTRFRVGNKGHIQTGAFSTEANVHLTAWGGTLQIGSHCSFNRNDIVVCRNNISIGNGTVIGPNVCIYDHDHVFCEEGKIDGEYNNSPINIGSNVWIGAGVIVLRGSSIGDNCVIGAGTVVRGTIPSNSLVTNQRELSIVQLENRKDEKKIQL